MEFRQSAIKEAVDYLRKTNWNGLEDLLEKAASDCESCEQGEWPEAVMMRWIELQTKWGVENWPRVWARDGLNYVTLQSLAETKRLGNKAKGSGKRRAATQAEGTDSKEAERMKKQAKAWKKHGRR